MWVGEIMVIGITDRREDLAGTFLVVDVPLVTSTTLFGHTLLEQGFELVDDCHVEAGDVGWSRLRVWRWWRGSLMAGALRVDMDAVDLGDPRGTAVALGRDAGDEVALRDCGQLSNDVEGQ